MQVGLLLGKRTTKSYTKQLTNFYPLFDDGFNLGIAGALLWLCLRRRGIRARRTCRRLGTMITAATGRHMCHSDDNAGVEGQCQYQSGEQHPAYGYRRCRRRAGRRTRPRPIGRLSGRSYRGHARPVGLCHLFLAESPSHTRSDRGRFLEAANVNRISGCLFDTRRALQPPI